MRNPSDIPMYCTDGDCVFRKPKGMHTNGGCRCLAIVRGSRERAVLRRQIKHLRDKAELLEQFVREVANGEHWPDEAVARAQEIVFKVSDA